LPAWCTVSRGEVVPAVTRPMRSRPRGEVAPELKTLAQQSPSRPAWRPALALMIEVANPQVTTGVKVNSAER
jgi:hypothetical protein